MILLFREHFSDTVSPFIVLEEFRRVEREKEEAAKLLDIIEPIKAEVKEVTNLDPKQEANKRMLTATKIVERMLNLNTYGDLARDFRFYEDPADEYRDNEVSDEQRIDREESSCLGNSPPTLDF